MTHPTVSMAQLDNPPPPMIEVKLPRSNWAWAVLLESGDNVSVKAQILAITTRAPRLIKIRRVSATLFDQRCFIYPFSICYEAYGVNDIIRLIMQPNEQNPNQQTPPPQQNYSSGFSNVPDYLHLEPVLGPQ